MASTKTASIISTNGNTKYSRVVSSVVVIGKESVGKSQLISSLTGRFAITGNFRGTTVSCEKYKWNKFEIIDTPGILREADAATTRIAIEQLEQQDIVLLIVNATHIDQDLDYLLPLVKDKCGAIVVTFWDIVSSYDGEIKILERLSTEAGMPLIPVDSRKLTDIDKKCIYEQLINPKAFPTGPLKVRTGWNIEPKKTFFDIPVVGQILSLVLLLIPAWLAVKNANSFANWLYGPVSSLLKPVLDSIATWPAPLNYVFGGSYGFVAMMPFLFLYAVPTVIVFTIILSVYKTSGLIDRLTIALDPIVHPVGLSGRDLIRVIMGFGCNVPAVINSRSCSATNRTTCVSAIGFGSACSYQLPATIAVFAAAGMGFLTIPYLIILAITTLIYLRFTSPLIARMPQNKLLFTGRAFVQWPSLKSTLHEAWSVMNRFLFIALPIFFCICLVASLMAWAGLLDFLSHTLSGVMTIFNLPAEASVAVILGSIRKDGIAIGLLNSDWQALKVPLKSPVQVMTIVYLSGVFLPCLVTTFTIAQELKWKFTLKMLLKQAAFAFCFSLIIAWVGKLIFG